MTITASSLAGFTLWDNAAGGSRSVGTVTAGRRVGVKVWYWNDTADDAFVAGDLTQTAGTATIGTPILAVQDGGSAGGGVFVRSAVWWVPVTGSGTLTLSVAANANSYGGISTEEFATDQAWDDTPEDSSGALNAADSQTSASSGNATSAGAAVFLGALCWNTGSAAGLALSNAPPWVSTGIESDASTHEPGAAGYRIVSSGTTDAAAWTGTMTADAFSGSAAVVAVFREVAAAATLEQDGFRFGLDDGSESAHTWAAAQNADLTRALGSAFLLRSLLQTTGDKGAITPVLRAQKNGAGGYQVVPVGASSSTTTSPSQPSSGTGTTVGTASATWNLTRPSASSGDLVVFVVGWDDSTTVSSVTAPAGPNSETAVSIVGPVASASTEVRVQAWYYLATGTWSGGTSAWTPSASETCRAVAFVIPAGQFNAADIIGWSNTRASTGTAEATVASPTGTADADDGDGRLFIAYCSDADAITAPASGTTTVNNATGGGVGLCVVSRNTLVSNSESVAAINATIASDSWASLAFVVHPDVDTVDHELYVAASANITAGGEATTSRLSGGTGTFLTGRRWDDENGSDALGDPSSDQNTEVEWSLNTQAPASNGDYWDFRVYDGTNPLDAYTEEPRLTIGAATAYTLTADSGTYTYTGQDALADYAVTASQGAYSLAGQVAGLRVARILTAEQGTYSLSGQAANFARGFGLNADSGTYSISGQAAGLLAARTVAAAQGTYTLAGQSAGLLAARSLLAAQGTYSLTGQDAGFVRGYGLTAEQGTYSVAGQAAAAAISRRLVAEQGSYVITGHSAILGSALAIEASQGSYSLTGQAAGLLLSRRLAAEGGTYSLSGQTADLVYGGADKTIAADQGSYAISGQDAALRVARRLVAESGNYSHSGQAAALVIARAMTAEQGSYAVSGQDATLTATQAKVLAADFGTYSLTGQDAGLAYSGAEQVIGGGWAPFVAAELRRRRTKKELLDERLEVTSPEVAAKVEALPDPVKAKVRRAGTITLRAFIGAETAASMSAEALEAELDAIQARTKEQKRRQRLMREDEELLLL